MSNSSGGVCYTVNYLLCNTSRHALLLQVPYPLWCPEHLEGPSGNFEALLPKTGETFNYRNSQGLMYEAMEVRRCLKEGESLENPLMLLCAVWRCPLIVSCKPSFYFSFFFLLRDILSHISSTVTYVQINMLSF